MINWTPRSNLAAPTGDARTDARANDVAQSAKHASARPWIVDDLDVPQSGSRTFDLSGSAWIAGYTVIVDAQSFTAAANVATDIYLGLVRDGNGNVTDVTLATSAHSSGDYVRLGAVSCGATDVTGRNYANRSPETQVEPPVTSLPAEDITYNNTASGLTAEDAQGAIDEVAALAQAGAPLILVKPSDQTFTSQSFVSVAGLKATLESGHYIIDGMLYYAADGTGSTQAMRLQFSGSNFEGFFAIESHALNTFPFQATSGNFNHGPENTDLLEIARPTTNNPTICYAKIKGQITVSAATSVQCNARLGFSGFNIKICANSFLRYTKSA